MSDLAYVLAGIPSNIFLTVTKYCRSVILTIHRPSMPCESHLKRCVADQPHHACLLLLVGFHRTKTRHSTAQLHVDTVRWQSCSWRAGQALMPGIRSVTPALGAHACLTCKISWEAYMISSGPFDHTPYTVLPLSKDGFG